MTVRRFVFGLSIRLLVILVLAIMRAKLFLFWDAIDRPLFATWHMFRPSADTSEYMPYPLGVNLGSFIFLVFTTAVYLPLLYLPNVVIFVGRSTRKALRTPVVFVAYSLIGALLGSALGVWLWSGLVMRNRDSSFTRVVIISALVFGWVLAILRCLVERHRSRAVA